jgi:hypothetical protein
LYSVVSFVGGVLAVNAANLNRSRNRNRNRNRNPKIATGYWGLGGNPSTIFFPMMV